MNNTRTPGWHDRATLPFVLFLAIGAYFLWTEYQAQVIDLLPWALILTCVGMHLFMHGGHGHGEHERRADRAAPKSADNDEEVKR